MTTDQAKLVEELRRIAGIAEAAAAELGLLARNCRTAAATMTQVRLRADWSATMLAAYVKVTADLKQLPPGIASANGDLRGLMDGLELLRQEQHGK